MTTIFDFLPEIVGSLLGVFVGTFIGFWVERRKKMEESKEIKIEYLNAVINEIKKNNEIIALASLIIHILDDGTVVNYYGEHMSTESTLSGTYSGEFRTLSINLQSQLAKYLMYCNFNNSFIDNLNFSSPSVIQGKNFAKQSVHYYNILKNYIPNVLITLEIELQGVNVHSN